MRIIPENGIPHLVRRAHDVRGLVRREAREAVRQLRASPVPLLVALVYPLAAWILLALAFRSPVIQDIPVVVVDRDQSSLSRTLIRMMDATQALRIERVTQDDDASAAALDDGRAVIAVQIPARMQADILRGGSAHVVAVANGGSLLWSRIAYRAVVTSAYTVSAGIQVRRFEARGLPAREAGARALPVRTVINAPGNPWYDYAVYLVPGMVLALLQMSASTSTLWVLRRRRGHDGGFHLPAHGLRLAALIGRLLPLAAANALAVLLVYGIVFPLARVPLTHHVPAIIGMTLLFTGVSMGFGVLLSLVFRNITTAAQAALIINAPAFVFAGYTFPRWAMPGVIGALANILPLTHLLDAWLPLSLHDTWTGAGLLPLLVIGAVVWSAVLALLAWRRA